MKYIGTATARGVVAGKVFHYRPYVPAAREKIQAVDCESALTQYHKARRMATEELNRLIQKVMKMNPDHARIFQAHKDILEDEVMEEDITGLISDGGMDAFSAVDTIYTQYAEALGAAEDELIAARAADMVDVRLRLLRCLEGKKECGLSALTEPVVLVCEDLLPSDTAVLDPALVDAIVTQVGSVTSHSAIIARSYGIPAIAGIENIYKTLPDGKKVIVNALNGYVIISPTHEELESYEQERTEFLSKVEEEKCYLNREAFTSNGTKISVLANIGKADSRELECSLYTDGVGLFRTEFLYMDRATLPNEEEQFQHYRRVLEAFAPNPVTLRTLDIGGDKKAECLDLAKEDNSFLGGRALRLCFDREEIFVTQLRAALRASVYGKLKIMFPMVSSIEDIRRAKAVVERVKQQLDNENVCWNDNVQIGIMIEIPAVAAIADLVAKEVDFASIGTNDLTQYTLAVDRVNPAVSQYYRPYHPAMMRLLALPIKKSKKPERASPVCGEMGGDPIAASALLGMGIQSLSMGASSIAAIKKLVCNIDMDKAERTVKEVCSLSTEEEVKNTLKSLL